MSAVDGATVEHVVGGLLRRGDEVLLCHRRADRPWYPDVWDQPGGHVEAGERAEAALVRELAEELGIEIDRPARPPDRVLTDDAAGLVLSIWVVDDWRGEPANCAPDEHDAIAWFRLADLDDLALADDAYRAVLAELLS